MKIALGQNGLGLKGTNSQRSDHTSTGNSGEEILLWADLYL